MKHNTRKAGINRSNSARTPRNKILVSAIVAALAMGAVGSAAAQSTTAYSMDINWDQTLALQNFVHSINNAQSLLGNVNAPISGSNIFFTGNGDGQPSTTTNNAISASALGNAAVPKANSSSLYGNTIDLGLLAATAPNSGLGILSGQVNEGDITATVATAAVATDLTAHYTGAVTHSDNIINAAATANDASSHIDGALPTTAFVGSTPASANVRAFAAPNFTTSNAAGDVVVSNAQMNYSAGGASANVSNSAIRVTDTPPGNTPISAAFSTNGNQIAATDAGNRADNGFNAASGGAVNYHGSAAVSNEQINYYALGTANVVNSGVTTTLGGVFTGTLSQSGNTILATAQDNDASNAITFASGIDVHGNASPTSLYVGDDGSQNLHPVANADLVALNMQLNWDANNSSSIGAGSDILATVGAASQAGTAITLGDDHILARTGASSASNSISAAAAAFDATAALGNMQSIVYFDGNSADTPTAASVTNVRLGAYMADPAQLSRGTVSVADSSIGASSSGNQANNAVTVAGTQFNAGSGAVTATSSSYGFVPSVNSGGAGVSIGSLQGNYYQPVAATVTAGWLGAYYAGGIAGGASTVSDSAISADAVVNDVTGTMTLGGSNGVFSAALANTQFNGNYGGTRGDVSAKVSGGIIGIYVDSGNVAAATLDVRGNGFSAGAVANRGSNVLATDFTNAALGSLAGSWTSPSGAIDAATGSNQATATLALVSNQKNQSNVTAALGTSQMGVDIAAGSLGATPVTVNGNLADASAISNTVMNTLSPGVGNLTTASGNAAQIATLGNLQISDDSVVSASVNPGPATTGQIYALVNGTASTSPISVSNNSVAAVAGGNSASNGMAISGANFAPTAVVGVTNGQSTYDGTTALASAAYTLQSVQNSVGGSRSATANNASIGADVFGDVSDSPLTVTGNSVGTDARDNRATDALSLTGFGTLDTTAALQNVQTSEATMTSRVSNTSIGAGSTGGAITGSALTISGNQLSAWAIANTASNALNVQGGQLSGNGDGIFGLRGANAASDLTLADYGLSSDQERTGTVAASITGGSIDGGLIGGGANGNISGGSMTVSGNGVTALAQSNSASNAVALSGTSIDASAALLNVQNVSTASNTNASVTSAFGFVAYAGGTLGAGTATPATVEGNSMVAQAGLNDATNMVAIGASSLIAGDANPNSVGASTSTFHDAVADYALYNGQTSASSATASLSPGTSGIEVDGAIGNGNATSALTVSGNIFSAQASANSAQNGVALTAAASTTASAALNNVQSATDGSISASNSGAQLGIMDDTGASIRNAALTVSDNNLSANASGNRASNAVQNLPVALNAGSPEATIGQVALNGDDARANNSLLNSQDNADAVNSSITDASIGVNPMATASSALLTSVATVGNNVASAIASGNSAGNSIELSNLPTGVSSSALVSNQVNSAAISATVSNTQIGVTAGATSSSPVTVTGNVVSATAVGNSVSNSISVGH